MSSCCFVIWYWDSKHNQAFTQHIINMWKESAFEKIFRHKKILWFALSHMIQGDCCKSSSPKQMCWPAAVIIMIQLTQPTGNWWDSLRPFMALVLTLYVVISYLCCHIQRLEFTVNPSKSIHKSECLDERVPSNIDSQVMKAAATSNRKHAFIVKPYCTP